MDGELIGAVSTVRDITELQQYEETMRRKMLQLVFEALKKFSVYNQKRSFVV
ncbi:hypothetical protein ABC255_10700 [Neobacillus sp. 3P2-tot-E-2]|uniref:hypothetical protein n=1 Tax=Neobacillus sp. 3P2-tot-E-2 TaxID=3132212 RepID=UPI00399FFF5C